MLRVDGTKIVRALFPLLKEFSWRLFCRYNPLGNLNSKKATSSRLYRILCSIRCAEKKSDRLTLSESIFTLRPFFISQIAWCAWKSLWKIFFYKHFSSKTVLLDSVFHALSHDMLFNESGFVFCRKKLLFRILYPAYIVALFFGPKFYNFTIIRSSMNSSHFAVPIHLFFKKNN